MELKHMLIVKYDINRTVLIVLYGIETDVERYGVVLGYGLNRTLWN